MGSDFFWFLDIFVLAALAAYIFRGAHKGAVSMVIGAVSSIAAFIIAFTLCGPISDAVYQSFVKDKIGTAISEQLGGMFGGDTVAALSQADMSRTIIKGQYLGDITPEYDDKNAAVLDVSSADMTETGLQYADLRAFGIGEDFDYSNVKIGYISVKKSDAEKYGLGNIVLARLLSLKLTEGKITGVFESIGGKFTETYSPGLSDFGKQLENGSADAIYSIVVSVISGETSDHAGQVISDIVSPIVLTPMKIIVFFILFALVLLVLTIIAEITKLINRIPVVSSVNGVLGAALGLVEGIVMLLIACLVIRLVIAMCGDSLVFLNQTTIDRTFIFRHIYSFGPLKLFGITG